MLGKVSIIVDAAMANFESDMGRAARIAEKQFGKMERDAKKMRDQMVQNAKVIGEALGLALSAAAAASVALARDLGRVAEEMQRFATLSGTSTETFQRWAAGARTVGIEQDKLADILKDMQDRVGDFMQTGGGPMADFFEQIAPRVGVTADAFARLSGPEAMQLFVNSLEKAGLSANEMVFYMEAIASDSTLLLPLLRDNGQAMGELGDRAADAGAIMGGDLLNASNAYIQASYEMDEATKGLKNTLGEQLLPRMTEMIHAFNDFASAGGGASAVAETMGRGFDVIAGVAQGVVASIRMVTVGIAEMVNQVSAWYDIVANISTLGFAPGTVKGGWNRAGQGVKNLIAAQSDNWSMLGDAGSRIINGSPAMQPGAADFSGVSSFAGSRPPRAPAAPRMPDVKPIKARTSAVTELSAAEKALADQEADWAAIQGVWDDASIERHNREVDRWAEKKETVEQVMSEMSVYAEQAGRNMQDAFAKFLFDPLDGGFKGMLESFADTLRKMAAQAAAAKIFESLGNTGAANGGTWWGAALSAMFGGGRANGGGVSGSKIYEVTEGGRPELLEQDGRTYLLPGSDGTVIPAGSMGGGGMAAAASPVFNINVHNAPAGADVQTKRNSGGGFDIDVILKQVDQYIGSGIASGTGSTYAASKGRFGLRDAV